MDKKKEWSVKVSMFEKEYLQLQYIAYDLDISLKKLINKSVKYAWKDYKSTYRIQRSNSIYIGDDDIKLYSFKVKEKQYERLKVISNNIDMNIKELLRSILSYYPNIVKKYEEYEDKWLDELF
ncbi:hypothetical protein [Clostridium perfringens]|uniref:Uncharacterized protein n=1 Tax=Clostridium perfringens TaxID=1502 RepID=A0AAP4EFA6_CLOPF|nr:hypothetical protein [Clostridium perfringens]MBO3313993.1 hypothetical protein [Clostridium perfringens]MDH2337130.1 hypothetical protein [Clostridium perfringens]